MTGIFSVAARMKHILSTPVAPPAGQSLLYFKGDALPYCKTPAGNEHPLVENVVTTPPVDSPVLSAVGSNVAITLVSEGLVNPSTVLNYYMDGVLIAATRSMVFVVSQETDGSPLDPDVTYTFTVVASNQFGNAPSSAPVVGALNLAVDTETILATVAAGFVLAGEIQVGNITISPDTGITIPLASGGQISFPADGSPAVIDAILRTNDLVVNGGMSINGVTNYINGKVWLASGVGNPQAVLDINTVSSRSIRRFSAITDAGTGCSGLGRTADGTKWGVVINLPTGSDKEFVIVDNATGARLWTYTSDAAVIDFRSVTAIGNNFIVFGRRYNSDRGASENILQVIDATTHAILDTTYPLNASGNRTIPVEYWDGAVCADPAGTHVWTARTQGSGMVRISKYLFNTSTNRVNAVLVSEVLTSGHDPLELVRSLYIGNADFGSLRYVCGAWGGTEPYGARTFNSAGVFQASESWAAAAYYPTGLYWDTTSGRFWSPWRDATSLYFSEYSADKTDRYVHAQYTWFDNNPDGGYKESAPSPINSHLIPRRGFPFYYIPAPPKSGTGEDDPNAVNLYTDTDSTTKFYSSITTATTYSFVATTLVGNGTHPDPAKPGLGLPPPVGSTFPSSSATGEIASASGVDYFRGTGSFHFGGISGTGNGYTVADPLKISGFQPVGAMIMYAGATEPGGWLICDGRAVLRSGIYAALAAALWDPTNSRYRFGNGDGSTTFNLPDMQSRFPAGVGASRILGEHESGYVYPPGETVTLRDERMAHRHNHGIDGQVPGNTYDTGTGGNPVPRHASYSGHSHGGVTGDKGLGGDNRTNHALLTLNFIIRYL